MSFHPFLSPALIVLYGLIWFALVAAGHFRGQPVLARSGAGALMLVILAGPSIPQEGAVADSNVEIFMAIDRTGSMAAEDWNDEQPRLDGVRRDVKDLVTHTPGARYSVITWDSTARIELPVTTDASAVTSLVEALHQEITEYSTGSTLNRPVEVLLDTLGDSARDRPQNARFLIVITDGEDTDVNAARASWEEIGSFIDGGAVLGYGTEEGGPMRLFDGDVTENYIEDPDDPGRPAISKMDATALSDLATELDVPLLLNPDGSGMSELGEQIMGGTSDYRESDYRYVVWPPAVVLFALLAWELNHAVSSVMRLRRSHAI